MMRTEWTPEQISPLEPQQTQPWPIVEGRREYPWAARVRPVETYRRAHEACAFSDALIRREQTTRLERIRYAFAGLLAVMGRTR